jgi:hypothetical protein
MLQRTPKQLLSKRQRRRRLAKKRRYRQRQREGRATAIVEFDHVTISWLVELGALAKADVFSRDQIGQALTKVVDASKMRGR